MKIHRQPISRIRDQSGTIAILVVLVLVVLVGIAALAVDIGYVATTKNELQNVADAAALAATGQLGAIYAGMSLEEQQSYVCGTGHIATIKDTAIDVASKNNAGGENINMLVEDIEIGTWDPSATPSERFTPTLNQPDAVRTTARRGGGGGNGPITTFFAKIFNIDNLDVSADATAALTAQSTAGPGGLPLPVGISKVWFENKEAFCDQPIKFYPTNSPEGCAGWNTYTESPPNAAILSDILEGLKDGTFESPETTAGETVFEFIGGTLATAFDDMKALFDAMKVLNDGVLDGDEDSTTWTTNVVVYDWPDCSNPNKPAPIVGFATVTITEILVTPEKTINALVVCENVEPGRGGGGKYGTKGTIPGIVE